MKRKLSLLILCAMTGLLSGCTATASPFPALAALLGVVLMALAALRHLSFLRHQARMRRRHSKRRVSRGLDGYTKLMYALAALLLVGALIAALIPGGARPDPTDPAASGNAGAVDPTGSTPSESTASTTLPQETEVPVFAPIPEGTPITLTAKQAFVYDCTQGQLLYSYGDMDAPMKPASLTKLFTAHVVLQYLSEDTVITVGDEVNKAVAGSSEAGLEPGNQLTVEMLLEGLLLSSGNDAAYVLATAAGRQILAQPDASINSAVSAFMDEMNRQLQAAGLTGTHFANPDGIDNDDHYSTMSDILAFSRMSLENEAVCRIAAIPEKTVTLLSGETLTWLNTNLLVNPATEYYSADAFGLKTGATPKAGVCLVSAFSCKKGVVLIGVFGCPEETDRFVDTLALYELVR